MEVIKLAYKFFIKHDRDLQFTIAAFKLNKKEVARLERMIEANNV